MSRESNDAFDAYAKREGYKPGTWNYLRAAKAWNAALAWAAEHDDASGVQASKWSGTTEPKLLWCRQCGEGVQPGLCRRPKGTEQPAECAAIAGVQEGGK